MNMQRGQTLFEVLAAFGVVVLVISALAVAVITALSNTQFSKNQKLATQYAQEGMETVRQKRNSQSLPTGVGAYCLDKNSLDLRVSLSFGCRINGQGNIDGIFTRDVVLQEDVSTECGGGSYWVDITVSWADSRCSSNIDCHKVQLTSCLSTAP